MTRRGSWAVAFALAFIVMAASAAEVLAQDRGRGDTRSRQDMQERVMEEFERRVAEELELSGGQATRFREALASFRDERSQLARRQGHLRMRIRRQIADADSDNGEARALIRALRDLREEELELQKAEDEALLRIVSPEQLLRFQVMREEFTDRIRRIQARDGRRGGGHE